MSQIYRPSGKISAAFYPMFILTMLILAPSMAFLHVYLMWYIPSTLGDIIVYIITLVLLCLFSSRYCIKIGKVRNPRAAVITACIIFVWFGYLSLTVYHTLYLGQNTPADFIASFQNPGAMLHTLHSLKENGYALETIKNGFMINYRGVVMVILWVVKFLVSIIYIGFYLWDDSVLPFSENTKRWAKKHEILLSAVLDVEEFKKQVLLGDDLAIKNMQSLKEANANHCEVTLFITEGEQNYYATFVNKIRDGEPDKDGNVKFEDEDIIKYIAISHDAGNVLLAQGKHQEVSAAARIVNGRTTSTGIRHLIGMFLASALQIGVLLFIVMDQERMKIAFSNPAVMFYLALNVLVWGVNFSLSFVKEDAVKVEGELHEGRGVRNYMVTKESSPVYYKLFYFIMLLLSSGILIYCLKEILL